MRKQDDPPDAPYLLNIIDMPALSTDLLYWFGGMGRILGEEIHSLRKVKQNV